MTASDGDIYVNYGAVSSVETALQDADIQIKNVLENLEQVISGLQSTWDGVSEAEYIQVQARWNNDITDMSSVLKNYIGTLGEMSWNYGNTDNNLAFRWSEIH
jgi:WXG100 family type VII secretion target